MAWRAGQLHSFPCSRRHIVSCCLPRARCTLQGHEIELLDQLTGGRVVPTATGDEGAASGAGAGAAGGAQAASQGSEEAFRPSTFSFLRSVTLRRDGEEERRASEGAEGAQPIDPVAAEATRRAFEGAVLAQWQRLRAMRVG